MSARVEAIHVAKASRLPMTSRDEVTVLEDEGLEGDRKAKKGGRGQVTLVSQEQLDEAAAEVGLEIAPGVTRRNVTVSGLRFAPEIGKRYEAGEVVFEISGDAAPCRLMDEVIGDGACAALRDRAGVRVRVIRGGTLRVGDAITTSEPSS